MGFDSVTNYQFVHSCDMNRDYTDSITRSLIRKRAAAFRWSAIAKTRKTARLLAKYYKDEINE